MTSNLDDLKRIYSKFNISEVSIFDVCELQKYFQARLFSVIRGRLHCFWLRSNELLTTALNLPSYQMAQRGIKLSV